MTDAQPVVSYASPQPPTVNMLSSSLGLAIILRTQGPDMSDPPAEYKRYLDERRWLHEGEQEYAASFDKWLLTLSGGALGISMTFLKDIIKEQPAEYLYCLFGAWLCLALGIAAILFSMRLSQKSHEKFREILDEQFSQQSESDVWNRVRDAQGKTWEPKAISCLGWVSIALFVIAIVLLSIFTIGNLAMNKENQSTNKPTYRGIREGTVDKHAAAPPMAPVAQQSNPRPPDRPTPASAPPPTAPTPHIPQPGPEPTPSPQPSAPPPRAPVPPPPTPAGD